MTTNLDPYKTQAVLDENDYLGMLQSLLPTGLIWGFFYRIVEDIIQDVIAGAAELQDAITGDVLQDVFTSTTEGGVDLFGRLLSCFSSELARFENRFWTLVREAVPGLSEELLPAWEQDLGLPEEGIAGQTLAERQQAAHAKYYEEYATTTEAFFISYAASLGFTIVIDTTSYSVTPRIMGVARMGATQPRMGGRGIYSTMIITVTAGVGTLDAMQATFQRLKQAHTVLVWVDAR